MKAHTIHLLMDWPHKCRIYKCICIESSKKSSWSLWQSVWSLTSVKGKTNHVWESKQLEIRKGDKLRNMCSV